MGACTGWSWHLPKLQRRHGPRRSVRNIRLALAFPVGHRPSPLFSFSRLHVDKRKFCRLSVLFLLSVSVISHFPNFLLGCRLSIRLLFHRLLSHRRHFPTSPSFSSPIVSGIFQLRQLARRLLFLIVSFLAFCF